MKKLKVKWKRAQIQDLNDRLLLYNLYLTQGLALLIGVIWIIFQGRNVLKLFAFPSGLQVLWWGLGLAAIMLLVDLLLSRIMPEDAMDDGGINQLLFQNRPIWHIICISAVVSVCEELLFRGAIQYSFGPYWTSILFAVIHIRYLRHWIPTGWVFLSSYGLGYIYVQTGSLWAPILCHFVIDLISGLALRFRRYEE
ncbi:type II CAAX prenyl endopeptidase Rce1 family protein [Paenibacillus farraposensis]|uniref:Type II CAAX prenyl endopeptidase Rce1 family protein n=1 Tax=Paenibacillus farraposensis TaxID=2807095 RepID=A0ABW4DH31_9BACL|nr:type II CAAX endopeptidase family protein [Paenibacillus farraposensis]MCC3379254.1 CPBP family intramembrane metalloprotease [Paenibacillus farraposensis]